MEEIAYKQLLTGIAKRFAKLSMLDAMDKKADDELRMFARRNGKEIVGKINRELTRIRVFDSNGTHWVQGDMVDAYLPEEIEMYEYVWRAKVAERLNFEVGTWRL